MWRQVLVACPILLEPTSLGWSRNLARELIPVLIIQSSVGSKICVLGIYEIPDHEITEIFRDYVKSLVSQSYSNILYDTAYHNWGFVLGQGSVLRL